MHPYVYKKQHKPLRSVLPVFIFIMILCPFNSQSCNIPVKMVKIYSTLAKGYLRIEDNKVVASNCRDNCMNDYLYEVTIDKHYMLIFHNRTGKFICWNKYFTKLVARRNPTNLTYCKFEDKISITQPTYWVRFITNYKGREVEMRFNKKGVFANRNRIKKCLKTKKLWGSFSKSDFLKLNSSTLVKLSCASPDFMINADKENCVSALPDFCAEMKIRKDNGHNITSELTDLCKNDWKKRN